MSNVHIYDEALELDVECRDCGATGLYMGLGERNGCAVVCHTCKGTGCEHIKLEFTKFKKRKKRTDVKRVFEHGAGFVHSAEDVTLEGQTIRFSEGGATYEEWLAGAELKPVKDLYCPFLWSGQALQLPDEDKNNLYKDRCSKKVALGHSITQCGFWGEKAHCWEQYEESEDGTKL